MVVDLLLFSSSRVAGGGMPFSYALDAIDAWLGDRRRTLYFAPYALKDHVMYEQYVRDAVAPLGVEVVGLHRVSDPVAAVREAEALYVGGGNTFRLLRDFQRLGLLEPVRDRVRSGALRYWGTSAGTNLAGPSIRTTNDMPIVQPPQGFGALGLVPFQVNPHYVDPDPGSTHMGETREQRITEFLEENDVPVVGLREGAYLRAQDGALRLDGVAGARIFRRGETPEEVASGTDLSPLLRVQARFDTPLA